VGGLIGARVNKVLGSGNFMTFGVKFVALNFPHLTVAWSLKSITLVRCQLLVQSAITQQTCLSFAPTITCKLN